MGVGKVRGQGTVPICASGKVRLVGNYLPLDGHGLGIQIHAQVTMVVEDVVFQQRIGELMVLSEARDGAQILSVPEMIHQGSTEIAGGAKWRSTTHGHHCYEQ